MSFQYTTQFVPWSMFFGLAGPRTGEEPGPELPPEKSAPLFAYHGGLHAVCLRAEFLGGPANQFIPFPIDMIRSLTVDGTEKERYPAWRLNELDIARNLPRLDPPQIDLGGGGGDMASMRRAAKAVVRKH